MRLYDTLTRRLQKLPPPPGPIRMYFCGPTVYQRIHIGNARPFVISLWLKRWLERSGYDVELAENITDINDKIYKAAPGDSARLAADATGWYLDDTGDLGVGRPDVEPKATESIPEIVAMIGQLVDSGHAYPSGGDVYFRVSSFPDYGRLSGRHGDEEATRNPSEEAEEAERKEDPRDFALWKGHKEDEDTWWDSPWGRGRPGWHIECSAMAETHLGPVFEIHGGGIDLVFPHHENEVAQSRSLGHGFAQLWMHNGMLRLSGEKMSKSLGNIVSLREALDEWGRETLLVYFLGGHWRKPIDYSDEVLEQAAAQVREFAEAHYVARTRASSVQWSDFATALDDDFNTPEGLRVLHQWRADGQLELLDRGLEVFGLVFERPTVYEETLTTTSTATASLELRVIRIGDAPEGVRDLAVDRQAARAAGDFARADELREEIRRQGWELQESDGEVRIVPKP